MRQAVARGQPPPAWESTPARGDPIELGPMSTYEVITRQMVENVAAELREIKGRLNGLLWMLAGAIIVDVALRLAGGGS